MTAPLTRDRELDVLSKGSLVEMIQERQISDLSTSKLTKTGKGDLIQMILEWEQAERMKAQKQAENMLVQGSANGHIPWALRSQSKKYDPLTPSKDAFRLKRLPSGRNEQAIAAWCVTNGFVNPEFEVDSKGLVMKATRDGTYGTYDMWATGGAYFAAPKK